MIDKNEIKKLDSTDFRFYIIRFINRTMPGLNNNDLPTLEDKVDASVLLSECCERYKNDPEESKTFNLQLRHLAFIISLEYNYP